MFFFFFSSRRRHTRSLRDWSSDVCSSDLALSCHLVIDYRLRRIVDRGPRACRSEPNRKLCLLTASRTVGNTPDRDVKSADFESKLGLHAHARTDRVAHETALGWQANIAAADDPVELAREPIRAATRPSRLHPAPRGDDVTPLVGLDKGRQPPRAGLRVVVEEDGNWLLCRLESRVPCAR